MYLSVYTERPHDQSGTAHSERVAPGSRKNGGQSGARVTDGKKGVLAGSKK